MYDKNMIPRASIGTERTRKKATPLDRLTRDCLAAEAAGMSYGQYKALHPHTGEDDRSAIAVYGKQESTCQHCGGTFYKERGTEQKYCCEECRHSASKARAAERKVNPKITEKTCPICGQVFKSQHGAKYCGWDCYTAGQRENVRRLKEKRREEAAQNGSV
jgi:rRNA maturation protein Nop10